MAFGDGWFWGRGGIERTNECERVGGRQRAGEGSWIDSAARVELRLCFGAVLCYVAPLHMRRIFSNPKSPLFGYERDCLRVRLRIVQAVLKKDVKKLRNVELSVGVATMQNCNFNSLIPLIFLENVEFKDEASDDRC